LEAGAGAWVSWHSHRHCRAGLNTPMSPLTDQDMRRSKAWLGNRWPLAGVMAGLSLPAHPCRPIVPVLARGRILLENSEMLKGARYGDCLEGWMNLGCGVWVGRIGHLHTRCQPKKRGGALLEHCSFRSTFGTEFLGTLELVRLHTESKKGALTGTLFQKCSKRNTFL
jgi:hypothetical protein